MESLPSYSSSTPPPGVTPFNDLNEVPPSIARYQGAWFTLEMVNWMQARSYELGTEGQPNLGLARAELIKTHQIEGDVWVPKQEEE